MQRVLAGLMIPLVLLQAMHLGFNDLIRLDELVEHAQFHQQEYGDSFFVFLSKHYGELKAQHEADHQEELPDHEQLPFQIVAQNGPVIAVVDERFNPDMNLIEFLEGRVINTHYLPSVSDPFKQGVFQPPQKA